MSNTHALNRTSPKGQDFIGTCSKCGMTGLPSEAVFQECENPRNQSQDEALLEAISPDSGMSSNSSPESSEKFKTTPLSWEQIARALYDLLDDCDTADDIAKENDAMFRNLVRRAHKKRFELAKTDGYTVEFNVLT